jgi:hypothetical protein
MSILPFQKVGFTGSNTYPYTVSVSYNVLEANFLVPKDDNGYNHFNNSFNYSNPYKGINNLTNIKLS